MDLLRKDKRKKAIIKYKARKRAEDEAAFKEKEADIKRTLRERDRAKDETAFKK